MDSVSTIDIYIQVGNVYLQSSIMYGYSVMCNIK